MIALKTEDMDSTRAPRLKLGGVPEFALYDWVFNALYKTSPVFDVVGHRVLFGDRRFNGPYDAHHVCFGGVNVNWQNPGATWYQARAERILWIGLAISHPKALVYPDNIPGRLRYLLVIDADPRRNKPTEYFMVILQIVNADTKAFITAFDISRQAWEAYRKKGPRYYPKPAAKPGGKKKG